MGDHFKYFFSTEKQMETRGEFNNGTYSSGEPLYIWPDSLLELELEFPDFDEIVFPEPIIDDDYP